MFDPVANIMSWFGILIGMFDVILAAFLTPVTALFGLPTPSLTSLLNGFTGM